MFNNSKLSVFFSGFSSVKYSSGYVIFLNFIASKEYKNFFIADRILAKHDEKYMPPELKDLVKKNVK